MKKVYLACLSVIFIITCGGDGVGTPELIYPINGEQVFLPFTFIWSSVDNSIGYHLEVSMDSTFSLPMFWVDVNDTTYTVTHASNGAYYWHVAAYDGDNELGEFTIPHNFEVATGSPPINLTVAAADMGLSVLLSWSEPYAGQPDYYRVYYVEVNTNNWVVVTTLDGTELSFTHDPMEATGDYYVTAVFSGYIYASDIVTTIPIYTTEMIIYELDGTGNGGYGWDVAGDFTGDTYSMADAVNADSVDFYITNWIDDPMGGPYPIPWSIASPDMAPNDPGGSFVPAANWRQNWFSDPISDPQAILPNFGPTTYFNWTGGIENDPTYIAVYLGTEHHYGLVKFTAINSSNGTIQAESWFQTIPELRLIAH